MKIALTVALAASLLASALAASPIIREPGVIYLSDFGEKPLRLPLRRAAPCFFDMGMTRYAGTLRFPQTVRVEAFAEEVCRIRGNAQQGGVAAWIPYAELDGLPEDFLSALHEAEERRVQVEELIAAREVAIGMTEAEVMRSVGRPKKRTRATDKSTVRQTWEYIRYQLVPQTTYAPGFNQTIVTVPGSTNHPSGMVVTGSAGWTSSTIYVRVPIGTLTVNFEDGVVTALEESEGNLTGGQLSIVVPPIDVYW